MKLLKIVNKCNQIEINPFYKVLNDIISKIDEKIELEKKQMRSILSKPLS